jgi:glycosyltransferase involved in cell wall biosynthesis
MKIAFDAKRAYQNETGLGNYSRTLISSLAQNYQQHTYYLCAPKLTNRFDASAFNNVHSITPVNYPTALRSFWRSNGVMKDLLANKVDIYHGLSHEIPYQINRTAIKSAVTIHDLIFERHPKQYNLIDTLIYRSKFRYACKHADRIIAISLQTKEDIIRFYKISENKIDVCYQSCNPAFAKPVDEGELLRIKNQYKLPDRFLLYVGSIIERKNLLNICKALHTLSSQQSISLVVIGKGGKYRLQVIDYCKQNNLQHRVRFLSYEARVGSDEKFTSGADFPAIYKQALCMIYPSIFEGFGIPVLEALWSRLPVITSNVSCMPETAGDAAVYVDPFSVEELSRAIFEITTDISLRETLKEKGWIQAQKFTPEKCAADVMDVYLRL